MTEKDNPLMYVHFIEEFIEAYKILEKEKPLPTNLFFVKAFLLGRTIELILKTELILKGYASAWLKKRDNGGHDLIKLLSLLGFPNDYLINVTTYESITHLNLYYGDKKYEYPQKNDVEIKNIKFLEDFIRLSIAKIKFHLNKDNKRLEYSS